ncbi:MAG: YggS family pyridoxal phosphate-dependent enzyme [Candidatus Obscuribacterales bacterium]|nr:YggS family pyridoxal phosphate-dependent enzyme [Candidatus Obscuribacterales bacterium]
MASNLARITEILADRPVKLVAVTKKADLAQIEEAFELGVTEFGENRIQDALEKREHLSPSLVHSANWHFIGHLQTNKVRQAVGNFCLIHSVDSLKLARQIGKTATAKGIIQAILLQVQILDDPSKSGFTPEQLLDQFAQIRAIPGLAIEGLMTITPHTDDQSIWRQSFSGLRELKTQLELAHAVTLKELSMGMTNDWREAVSQGATIVRLGRAIFN